MKKTYLLNLVAGISLLVLSPAISINAQDEEPDNRPIRPPFETISLIENATTVNLYKGGLNLEIQHRFSEIKDISDLFGIYGSANTRLALDYGFTDRIMAGFGTTRDYKLQDFEWKLALLTQTRSNSMPVSLSYYGNAVIDARSKDNFGPEDQYKFAHRLSYLTQLIVSHKVGPVSMQIMPSFAYFNAVANGYNNINLALSFGARAQVLGTHSIILEYDQPLTQHEALEVDPGLSFGVEIGTSTHSFRVFVTNYTSIIKQYNLFYNTNDPWAGEFRFGFNISIALR
ncbi:MAG TPA: hypothetical protein ENI20_15375 [Bacteroides sp.]|nr:hypothetical protein [Bacteroides sp.]